MTTDLQDDARYYRTISEVVVDAKAIALTRSFAGDLGPKWIAVFDWRTSGAMCASKTAPWVDTGEGLEIGGLRADEVPPEVMRMSDGLRYAVRVPKDVLDRLGRRVVYDADVFGHVKLVKE